MTDRALVVSVDGGEIMVLPLLKSDCTTCSAGCAKRGTAFAVKNPRDLPLKVGSAVRLCASRKMQGIQGFISLILPFLCAVAGYFCAGPIMGFFGKTAGDGAKALFVLFFLSLSSAGVFAVTRIKPLPGVPEIAEVLPV